MSRVLIFVCEIEDDQVMPEEGEYFDCVNTNWSWMDVRYAGSVPTQLLDRKNTSDLMIQGVL